MNKKTSVKDPCYILSSFQKNTRDKTHKSEEKMHNFSFLINKTTSALPLFDIDNQAECGILKI